MSSYYALKHLESLERHPCIYQGVDALPSLGPSWAPPVLLEVESEHHEAVAQASRCVPSTLLYFY